MGVTTFLSHHNLSAVKIILDVNRNMILGRPEDNLILEDIGKSLFLLDWV